MVDYDSNVWPEYIKPLMKTEKVLWHLYTQWLLANNSESIDTDTETDEGKHEQLWGSPWKTDSYHRGGTSLGAGSEHPNCGLERGWHIRKSSRSRKANNLIENATEGPERTFEKCSVSQITSKRKIKTKITCYAPSFRMSYRKDK